jgi:uroporphyrinogen-III synthase
MPPRTGNGVSWRTPPASPCHLGGIGVLVTRPAHQSAPLCELIERAHGRPVRFPTLEILGPSNPQTIRQQLAAVGPSDLLIFISANAAEFAFPLLPNTLPLDISIAAVGAATARALSDLGLEPTLVPSDSFDSEGLLALPELQAVHGRRIHIIRGNGGRPTLGDTLGERGATVDYVEVYRRGLPQRNPANLITGWTQMIDVVTVTSAAILDNLFTLLGESGVERVRHTPLIVISERVAEHAAGLGCESIYIADSAADTDILAELCRMVAESA